VDETEYQWPARNSQDFNEHCDPSGARVALSGDVWNEYLKVVGVRNPWDLVVSFFFWWLEEPGMLPSMPQNFNPFVRWHVLGACPVNLGYWLLDGQWWADVYLRFETIEEDCKALWQKLGVEFSGLPRLKTKSRAVPGIHYSAYYTDESVEMVRQAYAEVIDKFGYEFEDKR
jgi:hypothetical protein